MPRLPRKVKVDVTKHHAYHAKWRSMSPESPALRCVCVWNVWIDVKLLCFLKDIGRGPGTHDCLSRQAKTRQHGGVNVPADFEFSSWDVANPKTTMPTSIIWTSLCTFAAICTFDGLLPYLVLHLSTSVQHSDLRAWILIGNLWEGLRNRELRFTPGVTSR